MPSKVPQITIPNTDIWSTLFDRTEKPFPDNQIIYQCSTTNRNYTWAQLKKTTEQIGSGLRNHWSWKKGDVLALFSTNCIDTPAVTWGCHWAGGVVSPANPAYTAGELTHHLKDCGARVLFTQKALLPTALKATAAAGIAKENIILIGEERDESGQFKHFTDIIDGKPAGKRPEIIADKDLSFLVYSSGTTGLPKGVMLTHTNIVSNLFMINTCEGEFLKWNRDKVMSVLPYYHIYGLQILVHMPAFVGVTTIVMSRFNLESFCSLIQEHRMTYAYVAPPIILHLAKSDVVSQYDLSSLKTIVSGAAPLAKDLIYAVHKRLGIEIRQAYGLSETSPATHFQKKWNSGLGSVGAALPNQIIKFMSADETEVAAGKEGEIWVKGPNVFVGYHNNPSATASSITPDGYFKTGDIGYEDEDGNVFITDRVKELIKYKGFQVAPAELEGILASNDIVNDVAVIGIMDEARATEVPLAFVVAKPGVEQSKENAESIVKWLDDKVAGHKRLRGGVRWIDEIPKSASGKILRRLLKDLLAEEKKKEGLRAKL